MLSAKNATIFDTNIDNFADNGKPPPVRTFLPARESERCRSPDLVELMIIRLPTGDVPIMLREIYKGFFGLKTFRPINPFRFPTLLCFLPCRSSSRAFVPNESGELIRRTAAFFTRKICRRIFRVKPLGSNACRLRRIS